MHWIKKTYRKIRYWEFWPFWLAISPLFAFGIYFAIRSKKAFFFTNVNPAFENSGFMYSSKKEILDALPYDKIPLTTFIKKEEIASIDLTKFIEEKKMTFPLIAKPDKGERGLLVEKIETEVELWQYLNANNLDFIIQEFVDLPREIGIFFIKDPISKSIEITSVCLKDFLIVIGDGYSSVKDLLQADFHGKHQLKRLSEIDPKKLSYIPQKGKEFLIEPIGNHSRGTKFSNGNHLIDSALVNLVKNIIEPIEAYYGRFDIKYNSIEDLKEGKNFKILELNGSASEPTHIYDRKIPIWKKYKTIYDHWKIMFHISKVNMQKGILPISFKNGLLTLRAYKKYLKGINKKWKTAA